LDSVDDQREVPEWLKFRRANRGSAAPGGGSERQLALLEDEREEQFAASDEDYVYEKLEVPFLPEEGAYDPVGLFDDSTDAIEDRLACYNGQVVMNYVSTNYEQHMMVEEQKEERKQYIESIHAERLAVVEAGAWKEKQDNILSRDSGRRFDRKAFNWRDIQTPLLGNVVQMPDGGTFAEYAFGSNMKLIKNLTKVKGTVFMPPANLIQIVCSMGHLVRPVPTGPRIRSNAPWHLALLDVFFPMPFIVDDGSEYVDKKEENPTLTHLITMSINKETGEIELKHLLETIKFQGSAKYPKRSGLR